MNHISLSLFSLHSLKAAQDEGRPAHLLKASFPAIKNYIMTKLALLPPAPAPTTAPTTAPKVTQDVEMSGPSGSKA